MSVHEKESYKGGSCLAQKVITCVAILLAFTMKYIHYKLPIHKKTFAYNHDYRFVMKI